MEIIHVVLGKANPERMNGVNKVVFQLATRQVLARKDVTVWGITQDCTHNYPERVFQTRLFKAYKNKFRLDSAMIEAMKGKVGNAVFHLHGGFNPVFFSVSRQLHKLGIPYVFTPHGAYNEIARRRSRISKKIYTALFEQSLLKNAQYVHCLGKSEVEGLHSVNKSAAALLVPYGFEMVTNGQTIPSENKFIIGFCGRLDIYTKGLDLMVKAFALLKKQVPEAALWIIGDSKERSDLELMIANEQVSGIELLGSKYGEAKDDLLRQLHVFAHPSRNEGLPSSVLEAASFAVPCLVTEATNVGDAIRKYQAGIVIEQPEVTALYEGMMTLYQHVVSGNWHQISANARKMVIEEYNWNAIIPQFDKLYQQAS